MIHHLHTIDVLNFEAQYQDIIRPYLSMNEQQNQPRFLNQSPEKISMQIDLSQLSHVNSLILAFLMALARWANTKQLAYRILNTPQSLVELANVYGIHQLLNMPSIDNY